jgi:hypothetical protein
MQIPRDTRKAPIIIASNMGVLMLLARLYKLMWPRSCWEAIINDLRTGCAHFDGHGQQIGLLTTLVLYARYGEHPVLCKSSFKCVALDTVTRFIHHHHFRKGLFLSCIRKMFAFGAQQSFCVNGLFSSPLPTYYMPYICSHTLYRLFLDHGGDTPSSSYGC